MNDNLLDEKSNNLLVEAMLTPQFYPFEINYGNMMN